MNSVDPARNQVEGGLARRGALARLALILWTVTLTGVGLAVLAWLCWALVPPIPHDAAFIARFSVYDRFFYPQQPAKTLAFQLGLLATPLLVFACIAGGKRIVLGLDANVLRRGVRWALVLYLVFFADCILPLLHDPHPPLWLPPGWLLCPLPFPPPVPAWMWIFCLLLGLAFCLVLLAGGTRPPMRRRVVQVVAVFAILCAPVEFYAPAQVTGDDTAFSYHLNAMLDAVSQSVNGHHLLVDFAHIYGGYGEMLAPGLRLFPRTVAVPLLALALPTLLAIWFWLLAAGRLIRQPAVLALVGVALLGVNFLLAQPPSYCYSTPRTFFPSLGLLLAIAYLRQPTTARFWIVSTLAAVSSIWNLDTGLVLWLAWTGTLLAGDAHERAWKRAAGHLLAQAILLAAAWAVFLLYLRLASGRPPDPRLLFDFPDLVLKTGYFCVALIVPSAWTFLVLLYLSGLVIAALAHLRRRVPWKGRVVLFLSLLGTGMFSYYMGRAAESNLIAIASPGVLLVGVLADGARARIRHGLLPPVTRWFLFPWMLMIGWWAFLFFVQLPVTIKRERQLLVDAFARRPTALEINAQFARRLLTPGESDVYFLSGNSGFYYYLTGTTRPLRIPGNVELLQMRDMDVLIDALRTGRIPKLFAERNFWMLDMYRNTVYAAITDALAAGYQPVAHSPGGLILYVPKAATPPSSP